MKRKIEAPFLVKVDLSEKNLKREIVQTEKKERNVDWLIYGNHRHIEAQEERGQQQLINSTQMPTKINGRIYDLKTGESLSAIDVYKRLGFTFVAGKKGEIPLHSPEDEGFVDVILPEGWKKASTGHSMWTNLVDEKGRKRMSIFYKASFYDRDAFINVMKRFHSLCGIDKYRNLGTYANIKVEKRFGEVLDCDNQVFKTEDEIYSKPYKGKDGKDMTVHREWWNGHQDMEKRLEEEATKWLNEKYPNHNDYFAYWD